MSVGSPSPVTGARRHVEVTWLAQGCADFRRQSRSSNLGVLETEVLALLMGHFWNKTGIPVNASFFIMI